MRFAADYHSGAACKEGKTVRLLVIEDNQRMASLIRKRMSEEGYIVDVAADGEEGEEKAANASYDAIVLDLLLPDQDGVQICRNLRRRRVSTPILMLTALSTTADKVSGLNAGADDYLTKPFEFDELVARVRAIFRRGQPDEGTTLRFEDIEMCLTTRTIKRGDKPIQLTAREFALLEYFMRNPNRVLTRTSIGERVWDMNFEEESNVIEVYISRLRSKVDKGFDRQLIHTVAGSGYVLSADRAFA
jgi:DNA-binding response OmpR family regulator